MPLISLIWTMLNSSSAGGKGYVLKDPSRIDEVVEATLNENVPTIVDVHVDPNAPLPGKIVNEEAINYGKWAYRSITEDKN